MAVEKLSQIASGGIFTPSTDVVVTVRNGNTDVLTTIPSGAGPGGSQYAIQVNNGAAGGFYGDGGFFYNYSTGLVSINGTQTAIKLNITSDLNGGPAFFVNSHTNLVETNNNILDDGIGNATFAGSITLTGTGGSSKVLKQSTLSGAVTVAQLAFSDLSGSATTAQLPANSLKRSISVGFDGGGSALTAGKIIYLATIPYAGTITAWDLVADQSGSVVIDVWKANAAVPTVANTITASALPTLSSAQSAFAGAITAWTTAVSAGDVFAFKINSATTITECSLTILITAT